MNKIVIRSGCWKSEQKPDFRTKRIHTYPEYTSFAVGFRPLRHNKTLTLPSVMHGLAWADSTFIGRSSIRHWTDYNAVFQIVGFRPLRRKT